MSQKLDLKIKGLFLDPNNFSEVPQGGLEVANNLVINKDSLAESRRGQSIYGDTLADISSFHNYGDRLIIHAGTTLYWDSDNLGTFSALTGIFSPYGSKIRSCEANLNFYFTTNEGVFKLDALPASVGMPHTAGGFKALSGSGTITALATGFFEAGNQVAYRVLIGIEDANENLILGVPSERIVVINATANPENVNLTFVLPNTLTIFDNAIVQVYRSGLSGGATIIPNDELQLVYEAPITDADIGTGTMTILDQTPNDLRGAFLYTNPGQEGIANANEPPPICADIAHWNDQTFFANTKTIQRATVTLLSAEWGIFTMAATTVNLSTTLTVASTTGISVGMRISGVNIVPTWTTVSKVLTATTIQMSNAATGGGAITASFYDFIDIEGIRYNANTVENVVNREFKFFTAGTPAQDLEATCRSLISVINQDPASFVYGFYLSGFEDLPGKMLFEAQELSFAQFTMMATRGTLFSPNLPGLVPINNVAIGSPTIVTSLAHGLTTGDSILVSGTTSTPNINGTRIVTVTGVDTFTVPVTVTVSGTGGQFENTAITFHSANEVKQNRIYISKIGQPEAVPLYSFLDVGSANYAIHRVIPLRDSVFVFKEDGVFQIIGDSIQNFQVSVFDATVKVIAYDTLTTLSNQIYGLTDQGVASFSANGGVGVISRAIEGTLLEISDHDAITTSFAVGYESERLYLLAVPTFEEPDESPTQIFVYNYFTSAWTRWSLARVAGGVNRRDGKLYTATDTNVLKERKNLDETDFADLEFAVTIVSSSLFEVTVVDASELEIGMTLVQGTSAALIEDIVGNVLTLSLISTWAPGAAIAYAPILCELQWLPLDATNPGLVKQFRECTFFFKETNVRDLDVGFATNTSTATQIVTITIPTTGFGFGGFGEGLFGGGNFGQKAIRTLVPQSKQRAHLLNLSLSTEQSFTRFALQGVSLIFNAVSERFR